MNDRTEIEARFLKAAAALLHAGKKAAAAFEECGFISVRSFKTKQPRGHKNKAALSTKKPPYQQKSRDPHQVSLYACNKAAATMVN